jgi:hypothetical protein
MRKSQTGIELLIILGVVFTVILAVGFLFLRPTGKIDESKIEGILDIIASNADKVAEMGPGNRIKITIEIPPSVKSVLYRGSLITFKVETGKTISDFSKQTKAKIGGYNFSNLGMAKAGAASVMLENFGSSVCVYPLGQKEEYCHFSLDSAAINPVSPFTNDTLRCNFNLTGTLFVPIDVAWYKNNILWGGKYEQNIIADPSNNPSTTSLLGDVESIYLSKDDSWICQASTSGRYEMQQVNSSAVTITGFELPIAVSFISPTPENETLTTDRNIEINTSILAADSLLRELIYSWNNQNHTLYDDSIILMINFDNRSTLEESSSFVADLSFYGNNATPKGEAMPIKEGRYGGAFSFDGIDSYISCGNNETFTFVHTNNYTYSVWVKRDSETENMILSKGRTSGTEPKSGIGMLIDSDNKFVFISWEDSSTVNSSSTIGEEWTHLAAVYEEGNVILYIDGVHDSSGTLASVADDSLFDLLIGTREDNSWHFDGRLDELIIWNRSLSHAEIQQVYMTNLYKESQSQWYLYVNQTKNATELLDTDYLYKFQVHATDSEGSSDSTEIRQVRIPPRYVYFNATSIYPLEYILINVSPVNASGCNISIHRPDGYIDSFTSVGSPDCTISYRPSYLSGRYYVNASMNGYDWTNSSETQYFTVGPTSKSLVLGNLSVNTTKYYPREQLQFQFSLNDSEGKKLDGFNFGCQDFDAQVSYNRNAAMEIFWQTMYIGKDGKKVARIYVEFDGGYAYGQMYSGSYVNFSIYGSDGKSAIPPGVVLDSHTVGSVVSSSLTNQSGVWNWIVSLTGTVNNNEQWAYLEIEIPSGIHASDIVFAINSLRTKYHTTNTDYLVIGNEIVSTSNLPGGNSGDNHLKEGSRYSTSSIKYGYFPIYLPLTAIDSSNEGLVYVRMNNSDYELTEKSTFEADVTSSLGDYDYIFTWTDYINDTFDAKAFADKWGYSPVHSSNTIQLGVDSEKILKVGEIQSDKPSYFPSETTNFYFTINDEQDNPLEGLDWGYHYRTFDTTSRVSYFEIYSEIVSINASGYKKARLVYEGDTAVSAATCPNMPSGNYVNITIYASDGHSGVPEGINLTSGSWGSWTNTLTKNDDGTYSIYMKSEENIYYKRSYAYVEFLLPPGMSTSDIVYSIDEIWFASATCSSCSSGLRIANNYFGWSFNRKFRKGDKMNSVLGTLPIYLPLTPKFRGTTYVHLNSTSHSLNDLDDFLSKTGRSSIVASDVSNDGANYTFPVYFNDYINRTYSARACANRWMYNNNTAVCSPNSLVIPLNNTRTISLSDFASNQTTYALGETINFNWTSDPSFHYSDINRDPGSNRHAYIEIRRESVGIDESGNKTARIYIEYDTGLHGYRINPGTRVNITIYSRDGISGVSEDIYLSSGSSGSKHTHSLSKKADGTWKFSDKVTSDIFNGNHEWSYVEFKIPQNKSMSDIVFSIDSITPVVSAGASGSSATLYIFGKAFSPYASRFNQHIIYSSNTNNFGNLPFFAPLISEDGSKEGGFTYIKINKSSSAFEPVSFSSTPLIEVSSGVYSVNHTWQTDDAEPYSASACVDRWMHDEGEHCSEAIALNLS